MKKQEGMKRGIALVLCLALLAGIFAGEGISAFAQEKGSSVEKAYLSYVKKQQKKSKKPLYYAISTATAGKKSVLLISTGRFKVNDDIKGAVAAKVYGYRDGKVTYITEMASTGTGYPLLERGEYILSGWHHSSQKLKISGTAGCMEEVSGFGMGKETQAYYKKWTVKNGKKYDVKKKKISRKKAGKLDYYISAYEKGAESIIKFKKAESI